MAGASSGVVRQMGQANSTTGGYLAAIKLFDKFQVHREDPAFDNLTEEDVENDNLLVLLVLLVSDLGGEHPNP